jgi:hypothetical protein
LRGFGRGGKESCFEQESEATVSPA